jgi:signal peptidase I
MTAASFSGQPHRPEDAHLLIRFFVSLWLLLLIGRTFVIEPNQIPTGSMAPGRLGRHIVYSCKTCGFHFTLGILPDGTHGLPVCPNCGASGELLKTDQLMREGDRVWVSKPEFQFRPPERFEEVVFFSPDAPLTAHLKRVVGLPGEQIQIREGDLFINNQRLKKSVKQRREMGILAFDQHFAAKGVSHLARWHFSDVVANQFTILDDGMILFEPDAKSQNRLLQLDYRHVSPDRADYAPVDDFLAYNGRHVGIGHEVNDLWFLTTIQFKQLQSLGLRLTNRDLNIEIRLKTSDREIQYEVMLNNEIITPKLIGDPLQVKESGIFEMELSIVDRQLQFLINNQLVFMPMDLEQFQPRMPEERLRNSPVGFSFIANEIQLQHFRLFRDIYYTDRLAQEPVSGVAVNESLAIPADHYFVLGDNSPMSVDSRFWHKGPTVHRSSLIGRPIRRLK